MCVCVYVEACACESICGGLRKLLDAFLSHSVLFPEERSLPEPEVYHLVGVGGCASDQKALVILFSLLSIAVMAGICAVMLGYLCGCLEYSYPLSHLPGFKYVPFPPDFLLLRAEYKCSSPLPLTMLPSVSHLGKSQRSAHLEGSR